ncbi:solute carrier family 36 (proton-coupled amino acid transporter) [Pelomyxa schiedti]|nr:solute carrier family 36 (proton-coupled amino acid transporter) [Pelomyxa schiedti]
MGAGETTPLLMGGSGDTSHRSATATEDDFSSSDSDDDVSSTNSSNSDDASDDDAGEGTRKHEESPVDRARLGRGSSQESPTRIVGVEGIVRGHVSSSSSSSSSGGLVLAINQAEDDECASDEILRDSKAGGGSGSPSRHRTGTESSESENDEGSPSRSRSRRGTSVASLASWKHDPKRREAAAAARRGSSTLAATGQFVKTMLGAAILSMPKAFSESGLWLGFAIFPVVAAVVLACMIILLKCKRYANEAATGDPYKGPVITYKDVGATTSSVGKWSVLLIIVCMQLCYCTGWVIVMSNNLHSMLPQFSRIMQIIWLSPFLVLLSWIRFIKQLVYTSFLGLVIYIFGVLGVSYYYAIPNLDAAHYTATVAINYKQVPLFLSTLLYSSGAGFNSVISCESTLKEPKKAWFMAISGYPFYALLVLAYGTIMYVAGYGSCSIALDCLPPGTLVTVVKVLFMVALLVTFPLGLSVAFEVLEDEIFSDTTHIAVRCTSRSVLVIITCVVAMLMPDFSTFSNLVSFTIRKISHKIKAPFSLFVRDSVIYSVIYSTLLRIQNSS